MAAVAQQILEQALELPEDERIAMASDLLESVGPPPPERLTGQGWVTEIERRAAAAEAGSPSLSWQEARAQVTERLKNR